jgi:hypothetical protein
VLALVRVLVLLVVPATLAMLVAMLALEPR